MTKLSGRLAFSVFLSLFIISSEGKRYFELIFHDCKILLFQSSYVEANCTVNKTGYPNKIDLYVNNLQEVEHPAMNYVLQVNPKKGESFILFNVTFDDVCPLFKPNNLVDLSAILFRELSRLGHIPDGCPFPKDLYYTNNFYISVDTFPPYFPTEKWDLTVSGMVMNKKKKLTTVITAVINGELRRKFKKGHVITCARDGVNLKASRIINGTKAKLGQFPAQISIQKYENYPFCSGTLVSLDTIITAAHCFDDRKGTNNIKLVGNDLHAKSPGSAGRQETYARSILIHPDYDNYYYFNDIAAIRTKTKFNQTKNFYPIKWSYWTPKTNTICYVSGWGDTTGKFHDQVSSSILLFVDIKILLIKHCNKDGYSPMVTGKALCAGFVEGGKDACWGDSGSGLICNGLLAGVVSYGIGCAEPNFPGVYTDISGYQDWIDDSIEWDGSSVFSNAVLKYKNCATDVIFTMFLNYVLIMFGGKVW